MAETRDLILDAIAAAAPRGLTGGMVAAAVPHLHAAQAGHILAAMAYDGLVLRTETVPPVYSPAPGLRVEVTSTRVAVDLATGAATDDPDVVDEVEAEKLWTAAAQMFDWAGKRNPTPGDIERAAALIALARAHVRGRRLLPPGQIPCPAI